MAKATQSTEITLSYSLFDLPSVQHKAGLAGLLLLIDSLRQRGAGPLPNVSHLSATSAQLTFTEDALQTVFDDLYDAAQVEQRFKSKWKKKTPKREEVEESQDEKSGKVKRRKIYVYDVVEPKALFLEHHYPGDEKGWLKLWRDVLWSTLRARPTTRKVYERRMDNLPCKEAPLIWKALSKSIRKKRRAQPTVDTIPSSLFIGAQASNAERVPFTGAIEQNLLLHFWPLTVQIFVPETIDREGNTKLHGAYILAVPEVSDLEEFCEVFPRSLAALNPQLRGYRPAASIISVPEEGGLEFLRNLSQITQQQVESGEIKYSISAIELFSLEKQGNNVNTHTAAKIIPRQGLLSQYESIRQSCRNPFFKSRLLLNLLRDVEWTEGFLGLFLEHPSKFFIRADKTPRHFSTDVRRKFGAIADEFKRLEEAHAMAEDTIPKPQSLEKRIYDMIGSYVRQKTEAKSKIKWSDFKDKKTSDGKMAIPPAYIEARQKVCMDAFLAMRSRREQEFIEYFTGTICSVSQFLPSDDYVFVSQTLLEDGGWEKVKTLSMLALSAHS